MGRVNGQIILGILFLSVLPVWTWAEERNIYEAISKAFPSASPLLIIILGSASIFILATVVIWEIFKTERLRQEKAELSWKNFGHLIREKALDDAETETLKKIILQSNITNADSIFAAPGIYEKCLDAFIQLQRKKSSDTADLYEVLLRLRKKLGYTRLPQEVRLTSSRQFTPGWRVTFLPDKDAEPVQGSINDVNERFWSIEPIQGTLPHLAKGQTITLWFIRHGDAEYGMEGRVLEQGPEGYKLDHNLELDRKQLRNWVRVDVNIPCRARLMRPVTGQLHNPDIKAGTSYQGRLMDISGGGVCIRIDEKLPAGSLVSLSFDLPDTPVKHMHSEVLSSSPGASGGAPQFIHRLKFNEIETSIQEKIVRFVFEKNRMESQFR